jgi:hypothetical protein
VRGLGGGFLHREREGWIKSRGVWTRTRGVWTKTRGVWTKNRGVWTKSRGVWTKSRGVWTKSRGVWTKSRGVWTKTLVLGRSARRTRTTDSVQLRKDLLYHRGRGRVWSVKPKSSESLQHWVITLGLKPPMTH